MNGTMLGSKQHAKKRIPFKLNRSSTVPDSFDYQEEIAVSKMKLYQGKIRLYWTISSTESEPNLNYGSIQLLLYVSNLLSHYSMINCLKLSWTIFGNQFTLPANQLAELMLQGKDAEHHHKFMHKAKKKQEKPRFPKDLEWRLKTTTWFANSLFAGMQMFAALRNLIVRIGLLQFKACVCIWHAII